MKRRYVTAFAGRRDGYQVPLALEEAGALDLFITDFYASALVRQVCALLPARWRAKVQQRRCPGLPGQRVRALPRLLAFDFLAKRRGLPAKQRWAYADQQLSLAAAQRAARHKTDLLLYEPYAWEAFTASYAHRPARVLFHFHPHPDFEAEVLRQDATRFPTVSGEPWMCLDGGTAATAEIGGSKDAWRHADLILCASSFTRRSLLHCGADETKCRVVPYGIDLAARQPAHEPAPEKFEVLFVGSGLQRKGLHHLLMAWRQAALPPEAALTVVSRELDPQMRPLLEQAGPGVRWLPGVSAAHLSELFERSHLFVMPSLVEGFGLVFLEALAHGCPVMGTAHTALPDIGTESDGVFLIPAGDPGALSDALRRLAQNRGPLLALRPRARQLAMQFSWGAFRRRLQECLENFSLETAAVPTASRQP